MSIARQFNWKGQQRVDVPHLRILESGVVNDFDTLAGQSLSGGQPYVLSGFKITSWSAGNSPSALQLETAGGVMFHYGASENGTMLYVPSDRTPELLDVSNSRVIGGFTAGSANYIGIDYIRLEDSDTSDIVQFVDANTLGSTPKVVPLGRTLDYRIHISTIPFSTTTNLCPIAIVTTDGSNLIVDVQDARTMYFRLANGGESPNPLGVYPWPEGRDPEDVGSFTGGDKAISNEKDWKSAVMQRIWEVTGGEYWYSDTTDRNVRFTSTSPATLSDNIVFDSGTGLVEWEGLAVVLSNSTASYNTIQSNYVGGIAPNNTGIVLADGECLYVDIDRYTHGAVLTMVKADIDDVNALAQPRVGARYVVVWVKDVGGTLYAYSRFSDGNEIGRPLPTAAKGVLGIVKTNTAPADAANPYAIVATAQEGQAVASGLTRQGLAAGAGVLQIGGNAQDVNVATGKAHSFVGALVSECVIGGGDSNLITAAVTSIAGTIGGGKLNTFNANTSSYSTISGGHNNQISGATVTAATIGGGDSNIAQGISSVVSGGKGNQAATNYSTISGGDTNVIAGTSLYSAIGGGQLNSIDNDTAYTNIGGGQSNAVGTGAGAVAGYATIAGGNTNRIATAAGSNGQNATISGGQINAIGDAGDARGSTISGGYQNLIGSVVTPSQYATISGGYQNKADNNYSTVGGGLTNTASGLYSSVLGGASNTASGGSSIVAGGSSNTASGSYSAVLGGRDNTASGDYSAVLGGRLNVASALHSAVLNGYNNTANAERATVVAGADNPDALYGEVVVKSHTSKHKTSIITMGYQGASPLADTYTSLALDNGAADLSFISSGIWTIRVVACHMAQNNAGTIGYAALRTDQVLPILLYRDGGGALTALQGVASYTTFVDNIALGTLTLNIRISSPNLIFEMKFSEASSTRNYYLTLEVTRSTI